MHAFGQPNSASQAIAYPPGAPSLAQGPGSALIVTWSTPAGDGTHGAATGFNLQSSPSGAGLWTIVPGVISPYNLSGLASGAAIDVQVQSSNAAGASAWSAINTLTTGILAPNAPYAASLTQASGSALAVIWPAPPIDGTHGAATGYNLQSSPSGAGTWTIVQGVTSPYNLAGLAPGAAMDVQVQSMNAAGTSAWSATSTLTTATATVAPNIPGVLSLAQGAGGTLSVTWTAPAVDGAHSAPTGYNVRFSPSGAGTWMVVAGVFSPYNLSGLAAGAPIDVQVQSSNAAGTSAWSATSTLATAAAAPNTPSALSLAQGTGSSLTVSWMASTVDATHNDATGFNLRSSPSGAGTWTIVSGVSSPYTLSGLASGAAIDVQVQGSNVAGTSAWSDASTLTTGVAGPLAPNAPASVGVAPPADGTTSKLTVTWTAPAVDGTHDAATGFNLRTSPSGAGTWTTVTGVTSPHTLTGLAGATAIDIEVQGTNAAASPGAWSALTTGTTWGVTVAPGNWTAATSQVHNANVAPNGGVQMTATPAPTAVTGAAFAWSTSNSAIPTTGLITAATDGQTNGWAQYFNAPATTGTFYLWMLAQTGSAVTAGALVTSAITVS